MAGSYPDVPSRRMAWDADGTLVTGQQTARTDWIDSNEPTPAPDPYSEFSSVEAQTLNEEDMDSIVAGTGSLGAGTVNVVLIFPELREIDGYFWYTNMTDPKGMWLYTSPDTTNGYDGTWNALGSQVRRDDGDSPVGSKWRDFITSAAVANQRSLMAHASCGGGGGDETKIRSLHVYGEISAGETPDRLLWVDNDTGSEFGLPIDYGDIPRGSAEDREVLLRNNSASLTAASVQITAEALYLNSDAWYTFKEAGGSFQATLPLSSSIGAGSDSPVITLRRITPDSETLGLHAGRAKAIVGSWS